MEVASSGVAVSPWRALPKQPIRTSTNTPHPQPCATAPQHKGASEQPPRLRHRNILLQLPHSLDHHSTIISRTSTLARIEISRTRRHEHRCRCNGLGGSASLSNCATCRQWRPFSYACCRYGTDFQCIGVHGYWACGWYVIFLLR